MAHFLYCSFISVGRSVIFVNCSFDLSTIVDRSVPFTSFFHLINGNIPAIIIPRSSDALSDNPTIFPHSLNVSDIISNGTHSTFHNIFSVLSGAFSSPVFDIAYVTGENIASTIALPHFSTLSVVVSPGSSVCPNACMNSSFAGFRCSL